MKHYLSLFIFMLVFVETAFAGLLAEKITQLDGGLDQPSDIAVSDNGKVYVLDGVNNRVVVYMPNGEKDFIFDGGKNGLKQAMGITIAGGYVYIADSGHHRIAVFNMTGQFFKSLLLAGDRPPEPVALAIVDDVITWTDRRNHRVCRTDINTGETLRCWGKRGEADGEFQFPFQLKFGSDDYIHVVDVLNGRVQTFNHQGRYFSQVGRFGLEAGELYRPNGLAIYGDQYLLVSDTYRGTVSVFKDGRSVGLLLDNHGEALTFSSPVGLTIWHDRLYVVDMMNSRVDVFQLRENDARPVFNENKSGPSQKKCSVCHLAWAPDYDVSGDDQRGVPPVATERMCYSCHHGVVLDSRQTIGRGEQHPDIHHQRKEKNRTSKQKQADKIPESFPLLESHKRLRGQKGALSCGSCHTPHSADIDEADTLYSEHKNPWMRVLNNDGDLCQQCHESKLDDVRNKKRPSKGINHPVGIYLKTPVGNQAAAYATAENLHNGLPETLTTNGASLGARQTDVVPKLPPNPWCN